MQQNTSLSIPTHASWKKTSANFYMQHSLMARQSRHCSSHRRQGSGLSSFQAELAICSWALRCQAEIPGRLPKLLRAAQAYPECFCNMCRGDFRPRNLWQAVELDMHKNPGQIVMWLWSAGLLWTYWHSHPRSLVRGGGIMARLWCRRVGSKEAAALHDSALALVFWANYDRKWSWRARHAHCHSMHTHN